MSQRDPRNVRDALLEAGYTPSDVEVMLAAANGDLQRRLANEVLGMCVRELTRRARDASQNYVRDSFEFCAEVLARAELEPIVARFRTARDEARRTWDTRG